MMLNRTTFFTLVFSILIGNIYSQETDLNKETIEIRYLDEVPVYPGCKGSSKELKRCFYNNINKFVNRNFNKKLISNSFLSKGHNRIHLNFVINTMGKVSNIRVFKTGDRTLHPKIKQEFERLIKQLPKMKPGRINNKIINTKCGTLTNFFVE